MKKTLIVLLLIVPNFLFSQNPGKRTTRYGFDIDIKPPIHYTAFISYHTAQWESKLNFILKIQNDLLQFVKNDEHFDAAYEISLTVKREDQDTLVFSDIWSETVREYNFERTNDKRIYQETRQKFDLQVVPGSYTMDVEVTDLGNRKQFRNKRRIEIPEYQFSGFKISPVIVYENEREVTSEIHISERNPILEFNSDYRISYSILNRDAVQVLIRAVLIKQKNETEEVIFEKTNVLKADQVFELFTDSLSKNHLREGSYILRYIITAGAEEQKFDKKFDVIWYDKPLYLHKYDLAIRPMRYILSPEQWNEVDGLSYDSQEVWFEEYWYEKDPTPQTPFNEIKYEFFSRVQESNRKYSLRFLEGWETDRGKAFILYGEPDRTEKKSYAVSSKPYEIWYYDKINRKLTFVDIDNDANFKLVGIEDLNEKINE